MFSVICLTLSPPLFSTFISLSVYLFPSFPTRLFFLPLSSHLSLSVSLSAFLSLSPIATHCFPYVKKRIAVMYQHHTDLSPIEVAIDEMSGKVGELRALCSASEVDMIRLQLKLQGSISVQVCVLYMCVFVW